eukprot:Lithocolla_globosa_v1_NODE_2011_length_2208_cov_6.254529.p2 type:complete len:131 gc:universal NODE_2011_length_2208_cov_6.254529:53-445(+)
MLYALARTPTNELIGFPELILHLEHNLLVFLLHVFDLILSHSCEDWVCVGVVAKVILVMVLEHILVNILGLDVISQRVSIGEQKAHVIPIFCPHPVVILCHNYLRVIKNIHTRIDWFVQQQRGFLHVVSI